MNIIFRASTFSTEYSYIILIKSTFVWKYYSKIQMVPDFMKRSVGALNISLKKYRSLAYQNENK